MVRKTKQTTLSLSPTKRDPGKTNGQRSGANSAKKAASASSNEASDLADLLSSDSEDNSPTKAPKRPRESPKRSPTQNKKIAFKTTSVPAVRFALPPSMARPTDCAEPLPNDPWIVKYAPKTSSDVAIHKKKADEVRKALRDMTSGAIPIGFRPRILIVSGPTASSKTSIVLAIARELGYELNNETPGAPTILDWQNHDHIEGGSHMSESFEDFLSGIVFQSGGSAMKRMVLVEDLPNVGYAETKRKFNQALLQWAHQPLELNVPPLVVIATEYEVALDANQRGTSSNDSVIMERVLSKQLLTHPRVVRVKVSPVNATLITKTLKNIAAREKRTFGRITKSEMDTSIRSLAACGDIRSAINNFEFWARWRSTRTASSPVDRDGSIGLFHAAARVVHGSHKDSHGHPVVADGPTIDSVLRDWEYANNDGSVSGVVFENYTNAHGSRLPVETLAACSEVFSETDTLIRFNMPGTMSELCFRGVRLHLSQAKVTDGRHIPRQMVYSRDRKAKMKQLQVASAYDDYALRYMMQQGTMSCKVDLALNEGFYGPRITKTGSRLGGPISNQLTADANDPGEDAEPTVTIPSVLDSMPKNTGLSFSDDEIEDED